MNVLIDAGPIIALFDDGDDRHDEAIDFFKQFTGRLVTTCPVITECMWNMKSDERVQNKLLNDLADGKIYNIEPLIPKDYRRIAELNIKYADLPADFADLSLIAISERLSNPKIITFDEDFDVYRRFKRDHFKRVGFSS